MQSWTLGTRAALFVGILIALGGAVAVFLANRSDNRKPSPDVISREHAVSLAARYLPAGSGDPVLEEARLSTGQDGETVWVVRFGDVCVVLPESNSQRACHSFVTETLDARTGKLLTASS
jgi:hypothetical protein